MKPKLSIAVIAALFLVSTPLAAEEKAHSQQDKFSQCAHESKGLKGDERHKFMSECLKGPEQAERKPAHEKSVKEARNDSEPHPQQSRMKTCNEEAGRKSLHGDERRAFMSACLKSRD